MAYGIDRRSEGKTKTPEARKQRERRMRLKCMGICIRCENAEVFKRTMCEPCSITHNEQVLKSAAKRALTKGGIDVQKTLGVMADPLNEKFDDAFADVVLKYQDFLRSLV